MAQVIVDTETGEVIGNATQPVTVQQQDNLYCQGVWRPAVSPDRMMAIMWQEFWNCMWVQLMK